MTFCLYPCHLTLFGLTCAPSPLDVCPGLRTLGWAAPEPDMCLSLKSREGRAGGSSSLVLAELRVLFSPQHPPTGQGHWLKQGKKGAKEQSE
jgi:hypothetical protein